jgi:chromosome partitioning protein
MQRSIVLTILNLKGGVGKTHATWLVAAVCQERNSRVLLIDTDTQGNLSNSFLDPSNHAPGVETIFHAGAEPDIRRLIRKTAFSAIDIVPAGPALAAFDQSSQRDWEKLELHEALAQAIKPILSDYEYILFDCPPRLSLVSFASLCASQGVIIPMEAADWGAQGILQVSAAIEHVRERYNPSLRLLGYLVSRFKQRRAYQQSYLRQLRQQFGTKAFDTVIPDLALFEKSVCDRIPITVHAPRSREAELARQLFAEIERRVEGDEKLRRGFRAALVSAHAKTAA